MQETHGTQAQSLGQEDALEKEMATHARFLAWKLPRTEGPVHEVTESDTTEQLSTSMRDGNRGENSCDGGQNTRGTRHTRGEATAPTPRLRALQNMKTEVEMKRQATRRGKHLQIRLIRDFRKHSECQQLSNKSTINPIKKQVKDLKCQ